MGPQNGQQGLKRYVLERSHQLSRNKYFDPSTMRKGCSGGKEKKKRKDWWESWPLRHCQQSTAQTPNASAKICCVKALLIHKGRCQKHECFLTVMKQCKIFIWRGWDVNVLYVLRRPANPLFLTLIDDYYLFPFRKSGPEREFQNTTRHGGEEYFCSYVCNGHDWVSEWGLYYWVCRIK